MAGDWTILSMGSYNAYCSHTFNFLAITSFHATAAEDLIFADPCKFFSRHFSLKGIFTEMHPEMY
jgi:hypothetical protein